MKSPTSKQRKLAESLVYDRDVTDEEILAYFAYTERGERTPENRNIAWELLLSHEWLLSGRQLEDWLEDFYVPERGCWPGTVPLLCDFFKDYLHRWTHQPARWLRMRPWYEKAYRMACWIHRKGDYPEVSEAARRVLNK